MEFARADKDMLAFELEMVFPHFIEVQIMIFIFIPVFSGN